MNLAWKHSNGQDPFLRSIRTKGSSPLAIVSWASLRSQLHATHSNLSSTYTCNIPAGFWFSFTCSPVVLLWVLMWIVSGQFNKDLNEGEPWNGKSVWKGRNKSSIGYIKIQVELVVKNLPDNAGDIREHRFDPWVWKIPWRRKWQPIPVFSFCFFNCTHLTC